MSDDSLCPFELIVSVDIFVEFNKVVSSSSLNSLVIRKFDTLGGITRVTWLFVIPCSVSDFKHFNLSSESKRFLGKSEIVILMKSYNELFPKRKKNPISNTPVEATFP